MSSHSQKVCRTKVNDCIGEGIYGLGEQFTCNCIKSYLGCSNGGECINGLGEQFTCNCIKSYLRCSNGGECIDGLGEQFTCNCTHGWTGDTCQDNVDECQVNQSIYSKVI